MKRTVVAFACALTALVALCDEAKPKKKWAEMTPAEQEVAMQETRRKIYEKTGGEVLRPGTMVGRVVFVNAQDKVAVAVIEKDAAFIAKALKIRVDVVKGESVDVDTAGAALEKTQAQVGVFVVDRPLSRHALLIAPESRFAIVNVAPLAADGATGEKLAGRLRKELGRGFGIVSGAFNSKFDWTILGPVTGVRDLDRINEFYLTADIQPRIMSYLSELGVKAGEVKTYRRACAEGWAPTPTNDVQKAIWDKVHAIPSKPVKITFDKDKQKPVVK